jgi:hypothetical protein
MKNNFLLWVLIVASGIQRLAAQPVEQTDFEQFSGNTAFTRASWESAGFNVPWVDGFDAGRAVTDDSQAYTGMKSLRIFYPGGNFGTANTGGQAPLTVPPLNEYYASYAVRFSEDFSWGTTNEGGKLPGLSGGDRCSGCNNCTGSNGFTARLMWRKGGKAVIYLYHLNKNNPPCGDNFEIMLDGKNVVFQKGVWYKISQRVKVNSGTDNDGEVEMWINDRHAQIKLYNGNLVDKLTGLRFVTNGDKVDALYFSTFHGGGDASWSAATDSYAWFDDIVISTRLSDVVNSVVTGTDVSEVDPASKLISPVPVRHGEEVLLPGATSFSEVKWTELTGAFLHSGLVSCEGKTTAPHLLPGCYLIVFKKSDQVIINKVVIE